MHIICASLSLYIGCVLQMPSDAFERDMQAGMSMPYVSPRASQTAAEYLRADISVVISPRFDDNRITDARSVQLF